MSQGTKDKEACRRVFITRKFQNTENIAHISVLFSLAAPALLARDLHPGALAAPARPNLDGRRRRRNKARRRRRARPRRAYACGGCKRKTTADTGRGAKFMIEVIIEDLVDDINSVFEKYVLQKTLFDSR